MITKNRATRALLAAVVAAAAMLPALSAHAQDARWFHVRVEEPDATRVSLNLPLSLVEIGLEIADRHVHDEGFRWGREGRPGHGDVTVEDLRRMWIELKNAGDVDFVEIEDDDEYVRISRRGDRVLVRVDEGDHTRVRLETPASVVDALLGTDGDRLDLRAAIQELARSGRQDILDIQDGETLVRVWIDEEQGSERRP